MRMGLLGSLMLHAALVGAVWWLAQSRPEEITPQEESISVDIVGLVSDIRPDPSPMAPPETSPEPLPVEAAEEVEPVAADEPKKAPPKTGPPQKTRRSALEEAKGLIDPTRDEQGKRVTPTGTGSQLVQSEINAIRRKLDGCWRSWEDIPNAQDIVVVVQVTFTPDGGLQGRPQVLREQSRLPAGNTYVQRAIEDSLRAFTSCVPFPMAPNRQRPVTQVFRFSPSGDIAELP